jgi:putative membrane protein insertion efficiency factor
MQSAAKSRPALAGRLRLTGSLFAAPAHDSKADKGRGLRSSDEAHIYRGEERDTEIAVDPHGHAHTARPPGRGRNWPGPWRKTPGRLLGTSLVRLYQLTLSGFVGNSCRHLPTCSEYAHEAIARHGLWAGGWMGFFRVLRCGPFGTHGIDLVPEALADRYVWFMPWRYWRIGRKHGEATN